MCVCRVYANATAAYEALSAFDPCWFDKDELQRCNAAGRHVPAARTALSPLQYRRGLPGAQSFG